MIAFETTQAYTLRRRLQVTNMGVIQKCVCEE